MSSIKSPLSVTLDGMFEPANFFDRAIARLKASFREASGGGLLDRSGVVEGSAATMDPRACNCESGKLDELNGPYGWVVRPRISSEADRSSFAGGMGRPPGHSEAPRRIVESSGDLESGVIVPYMG
jgi:hypothetical protein